MQVSPKSHMLDGEQAYTLDTWPGLVLAREVNTRSRPPSRNVFVAQLTLTGVAVLVCNRDMENTELYGTERARHYVVAGELCLFTTEGGNVVMTWGSGCESLHFPDWMDMKTAIMAVIKHGGPTNYVDGIHTNVR